MKLNTPEAKLRNSKFGASELSRDELDPIRFNFWGEKASRLEPETKTGVEATVAGRKKLYMNNVNDARIMQSGNACAE